MRPAELRPAELRPAELRPAELRPAELRPAELRRAEIPFARRGVTLLALCRLAWMLCAASLTAPSALAQAPAAHRSCSVQHTGDPSPADRALADERFAEAATLYAAMPPSSAATVGVLRAEVGQHKLGEALALAQQQVSAHPDDALLLAGLGEVRFRRGEVYAAADALNRSTQLDPCSGRTHFDNYRYLLLEGRAHTAQGELDLAHRLAPDDPAILEAYERSHRQPMTQAQELQRLQTQLASASTVEAKTEVESHIKQLTAFGKGGCELVTPVETAKLPLDFIGNNANAPGEGKIGLDMALNGKRKRLELDTGASGLSITRAAAAALGLTPEAEIKIGGIGDKGATTSFVTHVDSIRMGSMEFHNCEVEVFEGKAVLPGQDGLVGADVFASFLVTLDFPAMELRLSPLPRRPGEQETAHALGTDAGESGTKSLADTRQDRYVAPEMKNWTPFFRAGHDIILPTSIGKVPEKLFLVDTGSSLSLIAPNAAREVTSVGREDGLTISGISGSVTNVFTTGALDLSFAGVRLHSTGLAAIDTASISRSTGVEISGLIGLPILRELNLEIDYRDDLLHVSYTPHVSTRDSR